LKQDGEISSQNYWDSEFKETLERRVKEELERELVGDETRAEVVDFARQIVHGELDA
jgi:predicted house-cleaning noncanonical NTP pyrophosphatase (MazG superfamily)